MILTPPDLASSSRPRRKFTCDEYERMIQLGILTEHHHPVELIRGDIVMKHSLRTSYRFTVDEYEQLVRHGVLTENDRVELIRGEILEKMSIGSPHAATVKRLNSLLNRVFGDRVTIGVQDPIRLADSEPEPDVSVLVYRADNYAEEHPTAADIRLVIEVADTSLDEDRQVEGPTYAQNGVREYWIVNLPDDCLEIHRSPRADGAYGDQFVLRRGQTAEIEAMPGVVLDVAELLAPAP